MIRIISVLVPQLLPWISAFDPGGATLDSANFSRSVAHVSWIMK